MNRKGRRERFKALGQRAKVHVDMSKNIGISIIIGVLSQWHRFWMGWRCVHTCVCVLGWGGVVVGICHSNFLESTYFPYLYAKEYVFKPTIYHPFHMQCQKSKRLTFMVILTLFWVHVHAWTFHEKGVMASSSLVSLKIHNF